MDNLENEIKLEERRHSLTWHRKVVKDTYESLVEKAKEKVNESWNPQGFRDPRPGEKLYQYYLSLDYTYLDVFAETYGEYVRKKRRQEINFYNSDEVYASDGKKVIKFDLTDKQRILEFNLLRIDFLKSLNLIDGMITRICDHNIDRSISKFGFNTSRAREAFIWLMCTSVSAKMVDVQDMNRLKTFYKIQINRSKRNQNKYYDHSNIEKDYIEVLENLERDSLKKENWQKSKEDALTKFKNSLNTLINEVFDIYAVLLGYRNYLVDTEKEIDDDDIYTLQGAVVMAASIKKVFIERFVAYSKIPEMGLGHSELSGVQFTRSDISHSNFINSNFKYARLDNSVANDCDFSICNFMKCDAKGATLNDCNFNYSNMSGMDLSGATLKNSLLDAVIFRDNKLDSSIDFADAMVQFNSELLGHYLSRLEALQKFNDISNVYKEEKKSPKQIIIEFYQGLSKDNIDNKELISYWGKTCVTDGDLSPRILKTEGSVDDSVGKFTVFDDIFAEAHKKLTDIKSDCNAKIISRELLENLKKAEMAETPSARFIRFRNFGSICFEPTLLKGANIIDSSLPQIDLSHIDMRGASFGGSDLSGSLGYYTKAETAYFGGANLNNAEFYAADMNDTNFKEASCVNSMFIDCNLHAVNMSNALAVGIIIVNTNREYPFLADLLSEVSDEKLFVKDLTENINDNEYLLNEKIDMVDSNWSEATATKSIFIGMKMDRSYFNKTNLSNCMIFNCAVRWSSFEKADISYGLLLGTSFHQSIFRDATVSQSHIFASEFSGCRMTNMILIGSRCDKVIFYDNDMTGANFSRCYFKNCVFRGCEFDKLNISKARFENCLFYKVDFRKCNGLETAYFDNCYIDNTNAKAYNMRDLSNPGASRKLVLKDKDSDGTGVAFTVECKGRNSGYDLYTNVK